MRMRKTQAVSINKISRKSDKVNNSHANRSLLDRRWKSNNHSSEEKIDLLGGDPIQDPKKFY